MRPKLHRKKSLRRQRQFYVNKTLTKPHPMSAEHSAHFLFEEAVKKAKKFNLPINIQIEHIIQLINESGIQPCFSSLTMTDPDNGFMLGNVTVRSIV